jgi:hypothetical protein
MAILVGDDGSRLPIFNHKKAKMGASITTNVEFND